jgi:TetR/AcrR family transcriptional regulator, transcriptional repressor for nem operon
MLTERSAKILSQERPTMPRAKAFDPDEALQKAMQIFWEHGYAATSVDTLVQGMGINRFSLYSTFGGKHQLFVAALDRYRDTIVADLVGELEHAVSGRAAIRQFFMRLVNFFASAHGWRGCLITNTAVELAPHDPQAAAKVQAYVVRLEEAFYRALLQAQQTGQLAAPSNCRDLARFLTGAALGLGVLAKTLPGRKALDGYAAVVLSVLE